MSEVIHQTNDQEVTEPATYYFPLDQQADRTNSAADISLGRPEGSDRHMELSIEDRERLELTF